MGRSVIYGESNERIVLPVPDPQVIILLDLNFAWTKEQIEKCKVLWNKGKSIQDIVKDMKITGKHKEFEVFSLLYYMAEKDMIEKRNGFIWGNQEG